jgi:cell division protein FtsI (penicillin-binding protein 3)
MAIEEKNNSLRMYLVAGIMFVVAVLVVIKLTNIQWVDGPYYRQLAKDLTVKNFQIPSNKGNIYSSDGSLLATSIPEYTVRFDAISPKKEDFEENVSMLADSLSILLQKPAGQILTELRRARASKNRYLLVARKLSYTEYMKIKGFPLFNKGTYKGGIITEQKTVREHPIGKIAERTIGYERLNADGSTNGKGIEYAFKKYLDGSNGHRMMQKIAKNQWKPISDVIYKILHIMLC